MLILKINIKKYYLNIFLNKIIFLKIITILILNTTLLYHRGIPAFPVFKKKRKK